MILVWSILMLMIVLLLLEKAIVNHSVNQIKVRIHVNGTRGKSSVVRYIHAGLEASENDTMAKITGVVPALFYNGKTQILERRGLARVQEQFYIIRLAARRKVKALTLECMSVTPELQRLESRIFKPHVYVLTNIRDDHPEVMGRSLHKQAESMAAAIPTNCTVVTNEKHYLPLLQKAVAGKNGKLVLSEPLSVHMLKNIPEGVFPENISLAMTACREAGYDTNYLSEVWLKKLENEEKPLALLTCEEKQIRFLNAFAVNDVASTEIFIQKWRAQKSVLDSFSVLLNTRADRPLRTGKLTNWLIENDAFIDQVLVCGNHANKALLDLKKHKPMRSKLYKVKQSELKRIKEFLFHKLIHNSLLIGMGNTGGDGKMILKQLK